MTRTTGIAVFFVVLLAAPAILAADAYVPVFEERVAAQRAIEAVYWSHRSWPEQNTGHKPDIDEVLPESALVGRVQDYLAKSAALETLFDRRIGPSELQAELNRMARATRRPEVLDQLFVALDHDATLIAECLVRPRLADRWIREAHASKTSPMQSFDAWWSERAPRVRPPTIPTGTYALPPLAGSCTDDTWTPTSARGPSARRGHTAVWTGSELVVWGGQDQTGFLASGGRYDPATDTWTETSPAPFVGRTFHTAIWTGSEMIVWGGQDQTGYLQSGGRYDPSTDKWTPTFVGAGMPAKRVSHTAVWTGSEIIVWGGIGSGNQMTDTGARYDPSADTWTPTGTGATVPTGRSNHAAVWTGAEMIIWGGSDGPSSLNTGGRYDPATDSWQTTSVGANVPAARDMPSAVWTGTEAILWGGTGQGQYLDDGGRYDPVTDSWTAMSTGPGTPAGRTFHTAVWTGNKMIVWGGTALGGVRLDSGGRYDAAADSWAATSTVANVPSARNGHSAVWTGREMLVWGGIDTGFTDTGGRYDPVLDSWTATGIGANVPQARSDHTAVWTGSRMVIWGGRMVSGGTVYLNSGGRYDPLTDSWTATSTGANVPGPRSAHTSVWSRQEMIVWGGYDGLLVGTGGRYDPLTDGWTTTSTGQNAAGARFGHTAVWADGEMIVWGSQNLAAAGSRYCACSNGTPGLVADLGVARPTAGSPTARLTWLAVAEASGYDVVRGKLSTLDANDGDFGASTETCLANNQATTTVDDAVAVSAGEGFWYLLRGVSCGGAGSYDSVGLQQSAPRDAAVASSGVSCP